MAIARVAEPAPARSAVVLAFLAVYVLWGSSYLGIAWAIASIPPFLMAGSRMFVAGVILTAWAASRGAVRPSAREMRSCAILGLLMLCVGNGAVTFAELTSASGRVALIVAMTPVWFVLIEWLRPGGTRPTGLVVTGLLTGATGVALLVGPDAFGGSSAAVVTGELVVLAGTLSWAAGSMFARHTPLPQSSALASGLQMLWAGLFLATFGLLRGEWTALDVAHITTRSWVGVVWLVLFPSLIGYSAYTWILKVSTPAKVGTYAYVNPVVAVALGWAFANEPVTGRMLAAAAVIVAGVALITWGKSVRAAAATDEVLEAEHA